MVRKFKEDILEQYEKPMPEIHWRKHKKQTIDLNESPFAIERQLEDQKQMMNFNRNPRVEDKVRGDKDRSERINTKKGASRAIAIKANVVNKIVREASGFHAYAVVPPPISKSKKVKEKEEIDPDTHPAMKPYAKEAIAKPIIKSFGHRPNSASRVFHPATMKIHLKHGEIAQSEGPSKSGFGLPVSILSKLLNAPKVNHAGADIFENSQSIATSSMQINDPNGLFTMPVELSMAYEPDFNFVTGEEDGDKDGGGLRNAGSMVRSKTKKQQVLTKGKKKAEKERPGWDESVNTLELNVDKFREKTSGLKEEAPPILERMTRFRSKAGPSQPTPYCDDRQRNDKSYLAGQSITLKIPEPVHGQPLYFDPLNEQLKDLVHHREKLVKQREDRIRDKLFKDALRTIPHVDYHPISKLKQMSGSSTIGSTTLGSDLSMGASSFLRSGASHKMPPLSQEELAKLFETGKTLEGMHDAVKVAKKGDKTALFKYFMKEDKSASIGVRAGANTTAMLEAEMQAANDSLVSDMEGWGGSFGDYQDQDKREVLGEDAAGDMDGFDDFRGGTMRRAGEPGKLGYGDDDDDLEGNPVVSPGGFYADYAAAMAAEGDAADERQER